MTNLIVSVDCEGKCNNYRYCGVFLKTKAEAQLNECIASQKAYEDVVSQRDKALNVLKKFIDDYDSDAINVMDLVDMLYREIKESELLKE